MMWTQLQESTKPAKLGSAILSSLSVSAVVIVLVGMPVCGTSVFSLVPVVLAELLGPEWVTSGMGVQMCFQGLGLIVAVVTVGNIFHSNSNYSLHLSNQAAFEQNLRVAP